RRFAQLVHARRQARALAELEHELPARRAERLVDARQHLSQPVGAVDREQPQTFGIIPSAESGQRRRERLAAQDAPLALVEDAETRVDSGREWMRAQQPVTEAVDGRDPRTVKRAREI